VSPVAAGPWRVDRLDLRARARICVDAMLDLSSLDVGLHALEIEAFAKSIGLSRAAVERHLVSRSVPSRRRDFDLAPWSQARSHALRHARGRACPAPPRLEDFAHHRHAVGFLSSRHRHRAGAEAG